MSYSPYYFYILQDKQASSYKVVRDLKEISSVLQAISPGIDVTTLYAQVTAGAEDQIFETAAYKLYKTTKPDAEIYATQFKPVVAVSSKSVE